MTDSSSETIRVRKLTKRFNRILAIDNISFTLRAGRVYGLIGANGAGKSTLLRIILGLVQPSSGTAEILQRPYAELGSPVRTVGAVVNASGLTPGWSGRTDLQQSCRELEIESAQLTAQAAAAGLLAQVSGLPLLDRVATEYSWGNQQRLALCRTQLSAPKILILDEPTTGLDAEGLIWLRGIIRKTAASGGTVLLSTHAMNEITALADEILVLGAGRLLHSRTVTGLRTSFGTEVLVRAETTSELAQALRAEGLTVEGGGQADPAGLVVRGGTTTQVGVIAAKSGIPLVHLSERECDLDAVLAKLAHPVDARS